MRILTIDVFPVVNVKENCGFGGVKVEKRPIAAGDAKRKCGGEKINFLDVQSRVAPTQDETFFLDGIQLLNFFR